MRAVTRHALTGLLLTAAAVGLASNLTHLYPLVSAEPRGTDVAVAPAPSQQPSPSADRDERSSRNGARPPAPSASESTPSGPSSSAVEKREKELAKIQDRRQAAAEELLERQIAEQGYDPRTADTPREIGRQIAANKYGWTGAQWRCYDQLIMSESKWDPHATNPTSGAYGIPQALPGHKMASAGADWRTNPATQIQWGLQYVQQVYGTPCGAWSFKQGHNWY